MSGVCSGQSRAQTRGHRAGPWSPLRPAVIAGVHDHRGGAWSPLRRAVIAGAVIAHGRRLLLLACRTLSERGEHRRPPTRQVAPLAVGPRGATCAGIRDTRVAPVRRDVTASAAGHAPRSAPTVASSDGHARDRIRTNHGVACGPGLLGAVAICGRLLPSARRTLAFLHGYASTPAKAAPVFAFQIHTMAHTHEGTELPDTRSCQSQPKSFTRPVLSLPRWSPMDYGFQQMHHRVSRRPGRHPGSPPPSPRCGPFLKN